MNVGEYIITNDDLRRIIKVKDCDGYGAEIVLTKEVFVQCYKKWIKESEKADKTYDLVEIGALNPGTTIEVGGIQMEILDSAYPADSGSFGVFCLVKDVLFQRAFDKTCNNWEKSSIRAYLNGEYRKKLIDTLVDDGYLLAMQRDLTSDDGLKDYGKCVDYISLISCEEYRTYREYISDKSKLWWTLTADSTPNSGNSDNARFVYRDGSLDSSIACDEDIGVTPVFLFHPSLNVRIIKESNKEMKDDD